MSEAFSAFYESWLSQLESFLQQLTSLSSYSSRDGIDLERACNDLVAKVLLHYREFHGEKAQAVNENPFVMVCPPWLSSFEKTLLWFGWFKPSIVFPLAKKALGERLSNYQQETIEKMRGDARRQEKEIEKDMARIQESIAVPPMLDLIRRHRVLVDGEISEMETEMANLKGRMARVMGIADSLRESTATKLLGILSPVQAVQFLAAAAQFAIQTRRWGVENDRSQSGDGASASDVSPF